MEHEFEAVYRRIRGADDVVDFLRCVYPYPECPLHGMVALGLDAESRVRGIGANGRRTLQQVECREVLSLAMELEASALVLACGVAPDAAVPTHFDFAAFARLDRACAEAGVAVLDCIIVSGHRWWSLRQRCADIRSVPGAPANPD